MADRTIPPATRAKSAPSFNASETLPIGLVERYLQVAVILARERCGENRCDDQRDRGRDCSMEKKRLRRSVSIVVIVLWPSSDERTSTLPIVTLLGVSESPCDDVIVIRLPLYPLSSMTTFTSCFAFSMVVRWVPSGSLVVTTCEPGSDLHAVHEREGIVVPGRRQHEAQRDFEHEKGAQDDRRPLEGCSNAQPFHVSHVFLPRNDVRRCVGRRNGVEKMSSKFKSSTRTPVAPVRQPRGDIVGAGRDRAGARCARCGRHVRPAGRPQCRRATNGVGHDALDNLAIGLEIVDQTLEHQTPVIHHRNALGGALDLTDLMR